MSGERAAEKALRERCDYIFEHTKNRCIRAKHSDSEHRWAKLEEERLEKLGYFTAQPAAPASQELQKLAEVPDSAIDTSDISEVKDWSKAEIGKFYRGSQVVEPFDARALAEKFAKQVTQYPNELREWREVRWETPKFEQVVAWFEKELVSAGRKAPASLSEEQVQGFIARLKEGADTLDGGKPICTCSTHAQLRADVYRQIAAELKALSG